MLLAIAVVATGLQWRSGVIPMPGWLSNNGGDALWALMVFIGIGFLLPRAPTWTIALLALTVSWGVDFSQLYHTPWLEAIRATLPGRLVLGTISNWPVLPAYAEGNIIGLLTEKNKFDRFASIWICRQVPGAESRQDPTQRLNHHSETNLGLRWIFSPLSRRVSTS